MKKCLCLLLACVLLLGAAPFARAESELEQQLAALDMRMPPIGAHAASKAVRERGALCATTDVVTLSGSSVQVETEEGLRLAFACPSENVVCLTQDLEQQALLYLYTFSENIVSVAEGFILDGMHLNIFDQETGTDIYVYTEVSPLSERLQNIAFYSDSDVLVIQQALRDNYFMGAENVSTGTVGNSLWFFADYGSDGVLLTFVNGSEVICAFHYADESGPVPAITLLENLTLSFV